MYYVFKKNLIWLLVILSVIFSIPVAAMSATCDSNYDLDTLSSRNSVVNFFTSRRYQGMGTAAICLNCIAIIYLLIHSIFLRRKLVKLELDLDMD